MEYWDLYQPSRVKYLVAPMLTKLITAITEKVYRALCERCYVGQKPNHFNWIQNERGIWTKTIKVHFGQKQGRPSRHYQHTSFLMIKNVIKKKNRVSLKSKSYTFGFYKSTSVHPVRNDTVRLKSGHVVQSIA